MAYLFVALLLLGLFAGLIYLLRLVHRYHKEGFFKALNQPVFDERQQFLSRKGLGYAVFTTFVLATLYMVLGFWIFPTVSARFVASSFFWLPATVLAAHNIWTGSYFALNAKPQHYHRLFSLLAVISLGMLVMTVTVASQQSFSAFWGHSGAGQTLFIPLSGLVESGIYFYRMWQEKREEVEEEQS